MEALFKDQCPTLCEGSIQHMDKPGVVKRVPGSHWID